jgi:hypothetical protein
VIGGWCCRSQIQNRSSLLPMSSSGPVIEVWAWSRKRRGGSQARRAESRGTPGTTSTACVAVALRTREVLSWTAATTCSSEAWGGSTRGSGIMPTW